MKDVINSLIILVVALSVLVGLSLAMGSMGYMFLFTVVAIPIVMIYNLVADTLFSK